MADLKLTVDVKSVADARKQLNDFQKAANSLSVNRLVSGVNSIENSIKQLVQARSKDIISQRAYKTGLQELAAAYQKMGYSAAKAEAMVKAYAAQLQRQRAAQEAARAAEELARAQAQAAERTRQLRLQFQQGYAASQRARQQVRDLNEAYRQGIVNADQYRAALARIREEQRRGGAAAQGSTRGINGMGVVIQQTGYQVGDFLVQVQSGTNFMVAFGQQATQLAGILPLLGAGFMGLSMTSLVALSAGLGIAIPLITAAGAAFMRTRSSAKDFGDNLKKLEDGISNYENAVKILNSTQQELEERFGSFAAIAGRIGQELETRALRQITEEVQAFANSIANTETMIGRISGATTRKLRELLGLKSIARNDEAIVDFANAILSLNQAEGIVNQVNAAENLLNTFDSIVGSQDQLNSQQEAYRKNLVDLIARLIELGGKIDDGADAAQKLARRFAYANLEYQQSRQNVYEVTEEVERLAKELDISVDYAQKLAELGFGNIWNGANGASQLASNLALAARMAANYQGRENAFGGVRVGGPPNMTSEGIEVLPQTLRPRNNPFAGMKLEDLLPPKEKTKDAEGPDAVERLREEIAFRQRTLNLSGEERTLQEEIFRITQALGKDRNKYSSDFIENLAKQNLAIQEQERVIEEARQQQENLADSIANSFGDAFMSIVDGTKSTKDAFKQMAAAIIKDLYQVYVMKRLIGSAEAGTGIAGAIMGGFGGGGPTRPVMRPTPQASGGYQMPGRPYLVGEHGPELVIPGRSGTVMNADLTNKAMGGESINIVNNINVTGGTDPAAIRQEVAKLMPQITNATKTAVIDARRRGGQMKAAFG